MTVRMMMRGSGESGMVWCALFHPWHTGSFVFSLLYFLLCFPLSSYSTLRSLDHTLTIDLIGDGVALDHIV